jgi:hypothetical protein
MKARNFSPIEPASEAREIPKTERASYKRHEPAIAVSARMGTANTRGTAAATGVLASKPVSKMSPAITDGRIETLRRQRHTGKQIAAEVEVSPATVSRVLRRLGLNRMRDLEPAEPERRYERENPGEIFHIDIKKLGPAIGLVRTRAAALAGISSTSVLTTIPASPSPRSSPTRRQTALFPFSGRLWLTTRASASPSLAS